MCADRRGLSIDGSKKREITVTQLKSKKRTESGGNRQARVGETELKRRSLLALYTAKKEKATPLKQHF